MPTFNLSDFSEEMYIFTIQDFYRSGESFATTARHVATKYGIRKKIENSVIKAIVDRFCTYGCIRKDHTNQPGTVKTVRIDPNIEKVRKAVEENPGFSITRISKEVGLSITTTWRIMREDIKLFPYKIFVTQEIPPDVPAKRLDFANAMVQMIDTHEIDPRKIWFSDEAHFNLTGYVNKQNWRHWGTNKPDFKMCAPLHSARVTAWCAVSGSGVIGPFWFERTVDGAGYKEMLEKKFFPALRERQDQDGQWWFMQDGARPHRTEDVFVTLFNHFGNNVIGLDFSRYGREGLAWPPYSPDLNPLDFWLWGFLKDSIMKQHRESTEHLKRMIQANIAAIPLDMCKKVVSNFDMRLRHLITTEGNHFENMLD